MRVNTDGVLLGSWVTIDQIQSVLDIGAGTGLLSLMIAQRCNAKIYGIEIEENAWRQACFNVERSAWKERIEIFHGDFQEYYKKCSLKYDLIISNPPYFKDSLKSPNAVKMTARHSESLPFDILLKGVSELLSDNGIFALILPQNNTFENDAFIYGLNCVRKTLVSSLPDKKVIRHLLEFKKNAGLSNVKLEELVIYKSPGVYSPTYIDLTKEYYYNF